jgi:ferredoxin
MAAFISDDCTCCDACLSECPTSAIVDDMKNPNKNGIYFVKSDVCNECGGEDPSCIDVCPSDAISLK